MKTIDTRDLYTRKCELEELRDAVTAAREELADWEAQDGDPQEIENYWGQHENLTDSLESAESDYGPDEQAELDELEELESEISDFMHGETLILERDFEAYARQYAEDCGDFNPNAPWPMSCIDWKQAAEELAMDYTSVTYQGKEYLVRA